MLGDTGGDMGIMLTSSFGAGANGVTNALLTPALFGGDFMVTDVVLWDRDVLGAADVDDEDVCDFDCDVA